MFDILSRCIAFLPFLFTSAGLEGSLKSGIGAFLHAERSFDLQHAMLYVTIPFALLVVQSLQFELVLMRLQKNH